jgi:hypothetical protein
MYMLFLQEAGRRKTPQEASADQIDSSDRISPETKLKVHHQDMLDGGVPQ